MTADTRPVPNVRGAAERFWRGARAGELWYQRCARCDEPVFPARVVCPACFSESLRWERSSGRGVVYSFTVIHQSRQPYFAGRVPYVVALIEVEPGFRMMSNVVGVAPDGVRIGMPVEAAYEPLAEAFGVPVFRPLAAEPGA